MTITKAKFSEFRTARGVAADQGRRPTRRQFLRQWSVLTAAASVAPAVLGRPVTTSPALVKPFSLAAFAAQTGTWFQVGPDSERGVSLRLMRVVDLRSQGAGVGAEQFALRFSGSTADPLAQGTYSFSHEALGQLAIFITRTGPQDGDALCYEAIFNRMPPGAPQLACPLI